METMQQKIDREHREEISRYNNREGEHSSFNRLLRGLKPLEDFKPYTSAETLSKNIGIAFYSDIKTKIIYQVFY